MTEINKKYNYSQTFYTAKLALRVELSIKGSEVAIPKDGYFFTIAPAKGNGTKEIDWIKGITSKFNLNELCALHAGLSILNRIIFLTPRSKHSLEPFQTFCANYFKKDYKNLLFVHQEVQTGLEAWTDASGDIKVTFSINKNKFVIPHINLLTLQQVLQGYIDLGLARNQD